ncbi:hypothetical protein [Microbacterium paraoxydans]|uniref:hypothetical protein n=1 Tax=Microbacterium paraoxydans TaxID=199592 RepID=UPI001CF998A5|nr:hypothetical protein [Microbacterium paraoxydans]
MSFEAEFDEPRFHRSVDAARKVAEDVAHAIFSLKQWDDWESHRPGVELTFYLALVDYETKVLVHRLMTSPGDRYIWEKYLTPPPRSTPEGAETDQRRDPRDGQARHRLTRVTRQLHCREPGVERGAEAHPR